MLRTYRFHFSVILCWTVSMIVGFCYGILCSSSVAGIYALSSQPRFTGCVLACLMPVILAVFIFRYRLSFLLLPLLIARGFLHGFSLACIRFIVGDMTWLDCLLHMSCQSISCSLLLFIIFGYHTLNKKSCSLIMVSVIIVLCILFFIILGKAC